MVFPKAIDVYNSKFLFFVSAKQFMTFTSEVLNVETFATI